MEHSEALAQLSGILDELGQRVKDVARLLHPAPGVTRPNAGMTLLDLVNEMLMAKATKAVRERYLTQLYHSMITFSNGRLHRPIDSFTLKEIEEWSNGRDWAPATRRSYLTDVRTLFNFAVKRDYLKKAPTKGLELPMLEDTSPAVHSPEQVQQILHTAQAMDKDLMRLLAVQYFSGARPLAEAAQLHENNLLPGLVEIEGPKSKCRKRRLVNIQPALKEFLKKGGKLPVKNLKRRWLAVREAAGVPWGHDVTRHSFCTYHLAAFCDAARTALEAGHTEQMLFSKYRSLRTMEGDLITKRLAKKFWEIRPA